MPDGHEPVGAERGGGDFPAPDVRGQAEGARQRNEVAIGYRLRAQFTDSSHAYGVVVNPPKNTTISFTAGDRIIVLAED